MLLQATYCYCVTISFLFPHVYCLFECSIPLATMSPSLNAGRVTMLFNRQRIRRTFSLIAKYKGSACVDSGTGTLWSSVSAARSVFWHDLSLISVKSTLSFNHEYRIRIIIIGFSFWFIYPNSMTIAACSAPSDLVDSDWRYTQP